MKSKAILTTALILILIQVCSCGQNGFIPVTGENNPTATVNSTQNTPSQIIGSVSNIRTPVRVGARNNLELLEGESDLDNEDFIKVTDGGKARLEFPGPISLLLYNQSDVDGIKLEYDENSNPRIVNRLIRGGFSGYVAPGKHLTIDLAFGVQVNVLGTSFFVLYDEKTGFITIGKFDGTLMVTVPGQNSISLLNAELVDITSDGSIKHFSPIPFTLQNFERAADSCNTPFQGLNILRRDNNIPLPGEATADKNRDLPCPPLIPVTASPETGCQTLMVNVKVKTVKMPEGPDLRYATVGEYKAGDQFTILGSYQQWFQVEAPDGKKGWLYIDWIKLPPEMETTTLCAVPYRDLPPTPRICYQKNTHTVCP